jgi:AcrR family transcriptional regulator
MGGSGAGRPYAASREEVEVLALKMMIRDGYASVTVDDIASQAGIGRTTVFRYFGSKSGIIWSAFDEANTQLRLLLTSAGSDEDPLEVVRGAICESTRNAIQHSEVWLERFELLDDSLHLRAEAYTHWEEWKFEIEKYLVGRLGADSQQTATAIVGAYHAIYVAELRSVRAFHRNGETFLSHLNRGLEQGLLDVCAIVQDARGRD